ncbi:MAG TPA: AraC family transcriptional regulator ligand-binding domain-containing protein [Aquabacterium sp.]|uniref:AraC family transcriptional regulator n=1 Tax=Aquabacterium sp. TaxID=1872578 RepID=UPI002E368566|nr:AraC family transcriptional regulator ligand-binding domain-containing protein [Aquabacterium sp.]HEX5354968.1 AraC family transcriptional regulator ligand-binding domain-containing protein [Aquabacterium sp.]
MTIATRQPSDKASRGFQASFVRVLPDTVSARGLSADPVWAALGLRPDHITDGARIPAAALSQALEIASELTGELQIALHAAQAVRPLHLGSLGYALMSSAVGEDGLRMFERFQTLLCDEFLAQHRVVKGLIEIRHEPIDIPLPRHVAFWWFLVGARLSFARWVYGRRDLVPVRIDLPCPRPAPAQADIFDRFVGIAVRYDTPDCRELMPADWLAWLNPNADPAMHQLMATRTAQQLAQRPSGDTMLMRARLVLAEHMRQGIELHLEGVTHAVAASDAQWAGVTPRQLQKRLAEQGLSFKELVEEVRRERALRLLRDTARSIGEIAQDCGYTEVSPFHRAVRRWTGLTPLQVRQQALSGHDTEQT